jgi:hypothetical protein
MKNGKTSVVMNLRTRHCPRLSRDARSTLDEMALKALRGVEGLPRRNGALVQPMHHHAYPRNKRSRFIPEDKP